jgi:Helix-turn-helix domain
VGENGQLPNQMLTPKQAAEVLGRTVDTLFDWREKRVGPPWVRYVGRIYYKRDDIDAWLAASRTDTINGHN